MMRSMAASMESFFGCRQASCRLNEFCLELRDRLVGEPDLVEFAALKTRPDDLKQAFVGDKGVAHRAGPPKVIRGDRIGIAHRLGIHDLQSTLDQHDLNPPIRIDKARRRQKFRFRKSLFLPTKTKRTGPGNPGRCEWGKSLVSRVAAGLFKVPAWPKKSEPIEDLVGPEALEPVQRLVQGREFLVRDAADLLHRLDVLLIERFDDAADFLALRGKANAERAAVDARALVVEEAEFNQLLQIVGDVRAEVIAARAQLARGQFLVADVIKQKRLHRIDVGTAAAIEFIL